MIQDETFCGGEGDSKGVQTEETLTDQEKDEVARIVASWFSTHAPTKQGRMERSEHHPPLTSKYGADSDYPLKVLLWLIGRDEDIMAVVLAVVAAGVITYPLICS